MFVRFVSLLCHCLRIFVSLPFWDSASGDFFGEKLKTVFMAKIYFDNENKF